MGRYRPPSSLDSALATTAAAKDKHPLGARARKSNVGILTVRFEMPFAIWCSTCPAKSHNCLIGQGVRFNAEKKRVGNYFSTPIWSFRMKHTTCGGWIEIRTDPKSTEYIVTEGARRRDIGDDALVSERTGGIVLPTGPEAEKEKARQDAFVALEGKAALKMQAKTDATRIEDLRSLKERDWRDPDASGRKLRAAFRVGRKTREKNAILTSQLQDKLSLGIDLLDENEDDRRRAGLVDFGANINSTTERDLELKTGAKPLFALPSARKLQEEPSTRLEILQRELTGNTRALIDPFTVGNTPARDPRSKPKGLHSRRTLSTNTALTTLPADGTLGDSDEPSHKPILSLVDYPSD